MTLEELLRQGKSFGQGASNAAASTVTGPVDMLAWLLRKGGVPVGDTPIGGEAWMRQKGLMATPENKLAGLLGEGAGLAAPIVAAAKAPEIAGGLLQMGRNLAAPQTMNKQTGAIVYHGSPHKFDKFDSSKIGTGEGAQAYGHGLYFAENPGVAQAYRDNLSKGNDPRDFISEIINKLHSDKAPINRASLSAEMARYEPTASIVKDDGIMGLVERAAKGYELKTDTWSTDAINALKQTDKMLPKMPEGSLFKVDLPDEHIAKMLDWDKPLLEQQSLLKSVPEFAEANQAVFGHPISTSEPLADMAYKTLSKHLGGADKAADLLRKRGIPGIRYLDGGSRMKTGGELIDVSQKNGQWFSKIRKTPSGQVGDVIPMAPGFTTSMPFKTESEARQWAQQQINGGTSNFVVFPGNEGLLKILERNGGKP